MTVSRSLFSASPPTVAVEITHRVRRRRCRRRRPCRSPRTLAKIYLRRRHPTERVEHGAGRGRRRRARVRRTARDSAWRSPFRQRPKCRCWWFEKVPSALRSDSHPLAGAQGRAVPPEAQPPTAAAWLSRGRPHCGRRRAATSSRNTKAAPRRTPASWICRRSTSSPCLRDRRVLSRTGCCARHATGRRCNFRGPHWSSSATVSPRREQPRGSHPPYGDTTKIRLSGTGFGRVVDGSWRRRQTRHRCMTSQDAGAALETRVEPSIRGTRPRARQISWARSS